MLQEDERSHFPDVSDAAPVPTLEPTEGGAAIATHAARCSGWGRRAPWTNFQRPSDLFENARAANSDLVRCPSCLGIVDKLVVLDPSCSSGSPGSWGPAGRTCAEAHGT